MSENFFFIRGTELTESYCTQIACIQLTSNFFNSKLFILQTNRIRTKSQSPSISLNQTIFIPLQTGLNSFESRHEKFKICISNVYSKFSNFL